MLRRFGVVGAATVLVVVLLGIAASSKPASPWVTPPSNGSTPATADTLPPDNGTSSGGGSGTNDELASGSLTALGIAVAALAGAAILVAVVTIARGLVLWGVPRYRIRRRPDRPELDPLEGERDDVEPDLDLEMTEARRALHEGVPRNAIVACWMQLEAEASWAGLPRLGHETSREYAERVIAEASVDPAPITELAALYREARFSAHEIGESHRAAAVAALERVEQALLRRVGAR